MNGGNKMDYFKLKVNARKRLLALVKSMGEVDEDTLVLKLEEEFGLSQKMIYRFIEQYHNLGVIKLDFGKIYDVTNEKIAKKLEKKQKKGKK